MLPAGNTIDIFLRSRIIAYILHNSTNEIVQSNNAQPIIVSVICRKAALNSCCPDRRSRRFLKKGMELTNERGVTMASITFEKVTKSFGSNTVIENLDLKIKDGSFTVLVGPSGCGKTTLLRMIAGIGPQTSGCVLIDDKDVTQIAPGKRGVAMVFQNYAIYPTMTVRDNIEFGLKNNRVPKAEREKLIREACDKVGLSEYLDRKPGTLSGGQRQRVALARAIVKKPSVFLMDEPLSNLDAKLRVQMRVELIELHHKLNTTFVYVTHDQVEAMSMADTIVLMNGGKIMQMASPSVMYRDPDNLFTARFIGSPAMNVRTINASGATLGFRPEKGLISLKPVENALSMKGEVIARELLGSVVNYSVRDAQGNVYIISTDDESYEMGQQLYVGCQFKNIYFFDFDEQRIRENDAQYATLLEETRRL